MPETPKIEKASHPRILKGDRYQHFKGGEYVAICEATEEATLTATVVYKGHDGKVWTRPADKFFGKVEVNGKLIPRFSLISDDDAINVGARGC